LFCDFPVRDVNLIEIENQFGYTGVYIFIQILNCSLHGTLSVLVNAALLVG
jgi:hypothetical protein